MNKTLYQRRRAMALSNTKQLRMMIAEGRQVLSARNAIKEAQRHMAYLRNSPT